jgi:hypothetical protein
MPDELDEFEIRTAQEQDRETERFEQPSPHRPPSRLVPVLLALLALAVLVAVGIFVFRYQPWKSRRPIAVSPAPTAGAQAPSAEPRGPLPPLDESDDYVRKIAAGLSAHPELARWLAQTALVRTATAVVSNIADGETPRPHLSFLAPKQPFRVAGAGRRRMVADPAGFAGYDAVGDAIAAIDARAAASVYRALEPLFDAAYRDLGHPEGFRGALDRAVAALLAVPMLPSDAELVPHAVGFRWADPRLEGLTAAQKQFLRSGPRNEQLVQTKLRELQAALAARAPLRETSPEDGSAAPDPTATAPGASARL